MVQPCDPCECLDMYYRNEAAARKGTMEIMCLIKALVTAISGDMADVISALQSLVPLSKTEGSALTTETAAQTDKQIIAAPADATQSIYITDIIISNGATAGDILIEEDTGGAKTVKIPKLYCAVNGGAVSNFTTPIKITAGKNVGFTSTTVTTHTILINYYVA